MQLEPIKERARGRWQGILPAIGVSSQYLTGKHGPCPMCGGKDRFRWTTKTVRALTSAQTAVPATV